MPTPVFLASKSDSFIYSIGRVGIDSGSQDPGGVFTGTLKTERFSPAGEHGYVQFRRVGLRVLHSGSFIVTAKAFVDEVQTRIYTTANPTGEDQIIVFNRPAPTSGGLQEALVKADISAVGTFIQFELTIDSDDITGAFLPESMEVHARAIRPVRQADAESQ